MKPVALTLAVVTAILGIAIGSAAMIALVAFALAVWLVVLVIQYWSSSLEVFHRADHREEAEARAELARLDGLPD